MTKSEWLACAEPRRLLRSLRRRSTDRKLRLFAVAGCRCVLPFVRQERLRMVANTVERYADNQATYREMVDAAKAAEQAGWILEGGHRPLADAAWCASAMNLWYWSRPIPRTLRIVGHLLAYDGGQSPHQAVLLRDIFGNPFRPVTFAPEWKTSTVVALAGQMYESRDFSAMPILADSLQDAGCDSEDIMNHCRGDGPHVRGCWVVDLVLGKE